MHEVPSHACTASYRHADRRAAAGGRSWLAALFVAASLAAPAAAGAADWAFAPSYFSHTDSPGSRGMPVQTRSAYRRAYIHAQPHFAIRGQRRFDNFMIRSGASFDRTLIREDSVDLLP